MEFLLTYGWAILAALVVIGALAYFGVLNPQRLVPTRCDIPGSIKCLDKKISLGAAPNLNIRLQNAVGNTIRVTQLAFASEEAGLASCAAAACTGSPSGLDILAGDAANCGITCTFAASLRVGARVRGKMSVTYTDLATQFPHTAVGELIADIE
jgi:hypothetical protein